MRVDCNNVWSNLNGTCCVLIANSALATAVAVISISQGLKVWGSQLTTVSCGLGFVFLARLLLRTVLQVNHQARPDLSLLSGRPPPLSVQQFLKRVKQILSFPGPIPAGDGAQGQAL